MQKQILALDIAGAPRKWVSAETAVCYYARSLVVWEYGVHAAVFRGGWQKGGERSRVCVASIVAIAGLNVLAGHERPPLVTNDKLFARDRHVCAYCGVSQSQRHLSRDHVIPVSRGGRDVWMNLVTACCHCNTRKGNRTPEEAHMPLLYLPYVPSRWEDFILVNRHILADQMEYLLAKVPPGSRLKN